jgi:phosphate-selective porin
MLFVAAVLGVLTAGAPAAAAAAPSQEPGVVSPAVPAQADARPAPRDAPRWSFTWDDRPSLRWGDRFRLDARLRLQNDFQWSPAFADGYDFFFALKRAGVRGNVGHAVTYAVDREVNVPAPWRDVYVNVRISPALEIQAGQFKLPFGLDQNTPLTSLDFVYRSRLGALLSPGRDPGVMVHGRSSDDRWTYFAGAFTHDGRTARIVGDERRVQGGATFAGRLHARPFGTSSTAVRTLQLGLATTLSDVPEGLPALRGTLPIGGTFLLPATPVNGRRVRIGLEAQWLPGTFSFRGELAHVMTERRRLGPGESDLSPLRATAWFASAIWIATGEKAVAGPDDPERPLFDGGPGALEIGARVERLSFDSSGAGPPSLAPDADAVARRSDLVWTFGATWYWNRWAKVQANLIRDRLTGQLTPSVSRWSRVVRLQLVF